MAQVRLIAPLILFVGAVACGKMPTDTPAEDMAQPQQKEDLSSASADMATDMTMVKDPMVEGLPANCPQEMVDNKALYEKTFRASCTNNGMGCHGKDNPNIAAPVIAAAEDLDKWIKKETKQTDKMPLVTPGNVDKSYLLYKVTGSHDKVLGVKTNPMPPPRMGVWTKLSDEHLCRLSSWVKGLK